MPVRKTDVKAKIVSIKQLMSRFIAAPRFDNADAEEFDLVPKLWHRGWFPTMSRNTRFSIFVKVGYI